MLIKLAHDLDRRIGRPLHDAYAAVHAAEQQRILVRRVPLGAPDAAADRRVGDRAAGVACVKDANRLVVAADRPVVLPRGMALDARDAAVKAG